MNHVTLIGRLTADPEISYTKGTKPLCVAKYSLAVGRTSPKQGEPDTDFIPCRALGAKGEFTGKYFKKGLRVAVSGELRIESYKDKSGNSKYSTYVLLSSQEFADGKQSEGSDNNGYVPVQNNGQQQNGNYQQGGYQQPQNQGYPNNGYNSGPGGQPQNGYNQGGYGQGYNQNGYNQNGNSQGGYNQGGYNQGQYNNNDFG